MSRSLPRHTANASPAPGNEIGRIGDRPFARARGSLRLPSVLAAPPRRICGHRTSLSFFPSSVARRALPAPRKEPTSGQRGQGGARARSARCRRGGHALPRSKRMRSCGRHRRRRPPVGRSGPAARPRRRHRPAGARRSGGGPRSGHPGPRDARIGGLAPVGDPCRGPRVLRLAGRSRSPGRRDRRDHGEPGVVGPTGPGRSPSTPLAGEPAPRSSPPIWLPPSPAATPPAR